MKKVMFYLILIAANNNITPFLALQKESKVDISSIKSLYAYIAELSHTFATSSFFSIVMIGTILLAGTTIYI